MMQARGRRKSMPIFRTESVDICDNDSDEDPCAHNTRRRRSRRHNKRHSRRNRQISPSPQRHMTEDAYEDSCPNAGEISFVSRDIPNQGELFYYMSGDSDNDSVPDTSDHLLNHRKPDGQSHASSEHLLNVLSPDHTSGVSYGGHAESHFQYSMTRSPEKIIIDGVGHHLDRRLSNENDPQHDEAYQYNTPRSERRRKNPSVDPKYLTPENPERNRSYSSDSNSSMRSFVSSITDHDHAEIHQIPFTQDYLASLEPREILLYRDVKDQSIRSSGLGMRVMFGKKGHGGKLGAFVSKVERNGPADSYGIRKGDQILLWNGKSLMGTTLEESMEVIGQSSDVVQLLVVHHVSSFSDNEETGPDKILSHKTAAQEAEDRSNCATPPSSLNLTRKRRMLPKTPVEIKKEDRNVSGCVRIAVTHEDSCLSITLISADNLVSFDTMTSLNPVVLVYLLPNRGSFPKHQAQPQFNTTSPSFNETFTYHGLQMEELSRLSLEVTLWSVTGEDHMFLGEVLLDFCDLQLDNQVRTYNLQDHDENSSPLPLRKRKESSDVTTASPLTSLNDGSSWSTSPGVQSSPRKDHPHGDDRVGHHMTSGLTNGRRYRLSVTQSVPNSPQLSPISQSEESVYLGGDHRGSISTLVRKRMSSAMSKVSVLSAESRRHSMYDRRKDKLTSRSSSISDATLETAWTSRNYDNPSPSSRRSGASSISGIEEFCKPPQPLNVGDNSGHFRKNEDDSSDENETRLSTTSGRLDPDGNDVTSLLGPGQVPPKPSSETAICGSIRLAFMVSKGQLELDIINVTELIRSHHITPPDTYVKAYLVGGSKVIQKKKTHIVKSSFCPFFRRTIKYSACNIHGRAIKVILWARHGAFDKKQSLGEAVIKLDGLDLMHQSTNWYKLFPPGATDFGSNESLNFW
nr:regulating synaptic membrane exocytosis protein 2-like isoform X3 [Crassostrea virginica]